MNILLAFLILLKHVRKSIWEWYLRNFAFSEFSDPKNMGIHASHVVVQLFNIFVKGGAFTTSQIPLPNWFLYMLKQY